MNNVRYVLIRVTKKSCRKKQKYDKEKYKGKVNMTEEIFHDELFFEDDAITCKNKTINTEIEEMFIVNSGSKSHMVSILKNMIKYEK